MDTLVDSTGSVTSYGAGARIVAFGRRWREARDLDWSLAPFYLHPKGAVRTHNAVTQYLPEIADMLGVGDIFLPEPEFGVRTAVDDMFLEKIRLNANQRSVRLHLGIKADSMRLRRGQTYGLAVGGCGVGWIHYPGNEELGLSPRFLAAHLGRDCLIDMRTICPSFGVQPRFYESVLHAMWKHFVYLPKSEQLRVEACIAFALPATLFAHPFHHPKFGERNVAMCNYIVEHWGRQCVEGWGTSHKQQGYISIENIARAQLLELGLPRANIHSVGSEMAGNSVQWHTTRGPEEFKTYRNLVLVTCV